MRRWLCQVAWVTTAVLALALTGLWAGGRWQEPADRLAGLIGQLGDDAFARREAAGRDLVAVGEEALAALREAAESNEQLEVRRRAERIIRAILRNAAQSKSTGMEFAVIDAGELSMGSAASEYGRRPDEAQHLARISRPFLLARYEVTQEQYQQVMKANPSWFAATSGGKDKVTGQDTRRYPVERVTWFDAVEFCNRLSEQDGFSPHYKLEGAKREEGAIVRATVTIASGNGYHLPTEAQWEYACRAGSGSRYHFGDSTTGREGNIKSLPPSGYGAAPARPDLNRTTQVGSYLPNLWGLYDVHGNAAEWCWDWYGREYYAGAPADNPAGPRTGTHRVLRGGSWLVSNGSCRSASRLFLVPEEKTYHVGFRVARTP
jgi:formylglycine-generating enzyme required for sulfatase activity